MKEMRIAVKMGGVLTSACSRRTNNGFSAILSGIEPHVEKMPRHTRDGFSGAPELAIKPVPAFRTADPQMIEGGNVGEWQD